MASQGGWVRVPRKWSLNQRSIVHHQPLLLTKRFPPLSDHSEVHSGGQSHRHRSQFKAAGVPHNLAPPLIGSIFLKLWESTRTLIWFLPSEPSLPTVTVADEWCHQWHHNKVDWTKDSDFHRSPSFTSAIHVSTEAKGSKGLQNIWTKIDVLTHSWVLSFQSRLWR